MGQKPRDGRYGPVGAAAERVCLRCEKTFNSTSRFDRRCPQCEAQDRYNSKRHFRVMFSHGGIHND